MVCNLHCQAPAHPPPPHHHKRQTPTPFASACLRQHPPQHKLAAGFACIQPVEECSAGASNMQVACGRGSKAHLDLKQDTAGADQSMAAATAYMPVCRWTHAVINLTISMNDVVKRVIQTWVQASQTSCSNLGASLTQSPPHHHI
jgi:hypothetical protein